MRRERSHSFGRLVAVPCCRRQHPHGCDPNTLARAIVDNLYHRQGRVAEFATRNEWYTAVALTVRDRLIDRFVKTSRVASARNTKMVCYLSAEFLIGPQLMQNLINLGLHDQFRQAVELLGLDFDELVEQEEEPGLGNGGLGRLAACFLESLATLGVPAIGYGLRYEFGIFDQEIRDGWQVEVTDKWLRWGNPWEVALPEISYPVKFGGRTEAYHDANGRYRVRWIPNRVVNGTPCEMPGLGYRVETTNLLRLWKAEATESFDFAAFNLGDYYGAVQAKVASENLTKVLYPNDRLTQGKQLRLEQQYFFVSCSLQDMLQLHLRARDPLERFHEHFVAQLNDTHPSIAVRGADAAPRRRAPDGLGHGVARDAGKPSPTRTTRCWPKRSNSGPCRCSARFCRGISRSSSKSIAGFSTRSGFAIRTTTTRVKRVSLIDEHGQKSVRMAHLASVGSHAINGVAALHTELLKHGVLRDFYDLYPERFHNVTNGVTPRRWMALCNPDLTSVDHRSHRRQRGFATRNRNCRASSRSPTTARSATRGAAVQRANKAALAAEIEKRASVRVDPESLFDVHVKRIHEYKRQHLNVLHIIRRYLRLLDDARRRAAADRGLRGQGGARLRDGEADHQVDHVRRRGRQPRPRGSRSVEGGVPARLQREERAAHLSGRGSVRADIDGGHRGLRHRQHEVRDERRVDDRDARRRERRDPRRRGRGEFLPVRAHRRRGPRHEGGGLQPSVDLRSEPAPAPRPRSDWVGAFLARR